MTLLGERNWYLPRWLEWIPQMQMPTPYSPRLSHWPRTWTTPVSLSKSPHC